MPGGVCFCPETRQTIECFPFVKFIRMPANRALNHRDERLSLLTFAAVNTHALQENYLSIRTELLVFVVFENTNGMADISTAVTRT